MNILPLLVAVIAAVVVLVEGVVVVAVTTQTVTVVVVGVRCRMVGQTSTQERHLRHFIELYKDLYQRCWFRRKLGFWTLEDVEM